MTNILYIVIGLITGSALVWLWAKANLNKQLQSVKDNAQQKYSALELEFASYKATSVAGLKNANDDLIEKQTSIDGMSKSLETIADDFKKLNGELATSNAELVASKKTIIEKNETITAKQSEIDSLQTKVNLITDDLATFRANNNALTEKLITQKSEMDELNKKFNTEFENIANKILETKTEKFTELNKTNLKAILEPLGLNITDFKNRVNEVYDKEAKERFSLGEEVKRLALLNQVISDEARNLTKALKGEAKTQGRWGEMILESILEKSGLVKDREYFMEHELLDDAGNAILSDSEGKKMRPDAVIKYPDNRHVIIDSKVSLNAFVRFIESDDVAVQKAELQQHINALRNHIVALSTKGYDDYDKSLDYVMMFIPSEPAYSAAMQGDPDLWSFAYDKRIVLINPTNLIIALKLITNLWKREYQNKNAIDIAERGAKLYDKFYGFVSNLEEVGIHIEKAQGKYTEAFKQLSTGNDNLVAQATKLKNLGVKIKKELPIDLVNTATDNLLSE